MSTHPGHLLFTVTDSGEGQPPQGRSSRLISRVWELAAAHGGEMFVNSGPEGTEIGFSMECTAYEDDGVTERAVPGRVEQGARVVIAAAADTVTRQMLPHYLSGMELRVWEARDAAEAASLYSAAPAALVVFDGSLAEDDMVQALASIRMYEGEHSLPAVPFLLLAKDALQAERMTKAGCDESLLRPLLRKDLRAMVRWLTAPAGSMPRPELSARSLTLAALLAGADSGSFRLQRKSSLKAVRTEKGGNVEGTAPVAVHEDAGLTLERDEADVQTAQAEAVPEAMQAQAGSPVEAAAGHETEAAPGSEQPELVSQTSVDAGADGLEGVEPLQLETNDCSLEDGPAFLNAADREPEGGQPSPEVDAAAVILPRLDALNEAFSCLDSPAIRRISAELVDFAESCGMRTLADMARGVGEAWEEADVEAAMQIVADMRAETARL
jgi:CheY-like chemotaxis protein